MVIHTQHTGLQRSPSQPTGACRTAERRKHTVRLCTKGSAALCLPTYLLPGFRRRERLRELELKVASLEQAPAPQDAQPSFSIRSVVPQEPLVPGQGVSAEQTPPSHAAYPLDQELQWSDLGLWLAPTSPEMASVQTGASENGPPRMELNARDGDSTLLGSSGPVSMEMNARDVDSALLNSSGAVIPHTLQQHPVSTISGQSLPEEDSD